MFSSEPHRSGFRLRDLLVVIGLVVVVLGLMLPAVRRVRPAAARSQSTNNLKQLCLGMNGIAVRNEGLLPPSVGKYPEDGPQASVFFHVLPDIEQDNLYQKYWNGEGYENGGPTAATETIKTFHAPLDSTNPGNLNYTSYASNAAVLGLTDGGTTRYPKDFKKHGTSNTILFMERFAVVGPNHLRHTWPSCDDRDNYLYPRTDDPPEPVKIAVPQFGVAPNEASNFAPHAFGGEKKLQVGLADGSVRTVAPDVTNTFYYAGGKTATIWAWACSVDGPLGEAPPPAGW